MDQTAAPKPPASFGETRGVTSSRTLASNSFSETGLVTNALAPTAAPIARSLILCAGGQDDDGQVGELPDAAAYLPAVHAGHRHIQQHRVGLLQKHLRQTIVTAGDGNDAVPLPLK